MKQIIAIVLFLICSTGGYAQRVNNNGGTTKSQKQSQVSTNSKQPNKMVESIIKTNQKVDLGLSVYWAGYNVDASSPEQSGRIFGWADPSGTKTSVYQKDYPNNTPPLNICGSLQYDMATVNWGSPWRLPNRNELEELCEKCKWESYIYNGMKGFKVTGPNNNAIFLPVTEHRQQYYRNGSPLPLENSPATEYAHYYSGELSTNGGRWTIDDARPYYLWLHYENFYGRPYVHDDGLRSHAYAVRAVCPK